MKKYMEKYKMNKSSVRKPPLSEKEKEKKAEDFLNFTSNKYERSNAQKEQSKEKTRILKKEPVKTLALRFLISLVDDICEISAYGRKL